MGEREFDVVVVGATGVTGRRVAAYLSQRTGDAGTSWAAAGRNSDRLAAVLSEVGANPAATITVDSGDEEELRALARPGTDVPQPRRSLTPATRGRWSRPASAAAPGTST